MARQFGSRPSELFKLADETVGMAFDIAATLLLHQQETIAEDNRQNRLLASLAGGLAGAPSAVQWESIEEF